MSLTAARHDDLFDFFYSALHRYEVVGQRRVPLGCWGGFQDPDACMVVTAWPEMRRYRRMRVM